MVCPSLRESASNGVEQVFRMNITDAISSILAGVGLLAVLVTLYADHDRRKKQATIEYSNAIRDLWRTRRLSIENISGKHVDRDEVISDEDAKKLHEDATASNDVRELLARLEHLALGANTRVFDRTLLFRMSGTYFTRLYEYLHNYVQLSRKHTPAAYVEFEDLIKEFKNLQRRFDDPRNAGGRVLL
jgi:hypothetical protein